MLMTLNLFVDSYKASVRRQISEEINCKAINVQVFKILRFSLIPI